VAAPRKWAIPLLLADVGLLTSGGMARLAKRPSRKVDEPVAEAA
jgi:phosphatidylglycerol lysyltransferase